MFRLRAPRLRATLALTTALTLAAGACSDDPVSPGDQEQILAVWSVTSFVAGDTDLIGNGMTLVITLDNDGTYMFEVTNDMADICGGTGGENCTTNGSFDYTASTVTINDDEPQDATTFQYDISGATMTWTGTIGTEAVVITLTEVS